ncbi:hypothetical protein D6C99_01443 [Aureobasidium pullulans]|nr:hypothetical protein D6C99_01443 [Aureobasidium pullulans]
MDTTPRVNRGLRYLSHDQYKDTEPELVAANIAKFRLLQSFDLSLVHLPLQPSRPHDVAVRVPQHPSQPERLIWFDFMVLLEDKAGSASRPGTLTMESRANRSPPAFYVVIFPSSPGYMALVPHAVAWQDREGAGFDIIGTGITGPFFPYLMPERLIPMALKSISMIPWGRLYTNPGTGVVLKRWLPTMTESRRDTPTAPLLLEPWSSTPRPSNAAGKKRRHDSVPEEDFVRQAPALRERATRAVMPSLGIPDFEFDNGLTEHDLFGFDWLSAESSAFSVPQDVACDVGVPGGQQSFENIQPASTQHSAPAKADTEVAKDVLDYTNFDLPEMWGLGFEGSVNSAQQNVVPAFQFTMPEDPDWFLSTTHAGPVTASVTAQAQGQVTTAASLRAIAPAPLAIEAGPSHTSPVVESAGPSSYAQDSSTAMVPLSYSDVDDEEEEDADYEVEVEVEVESEHEADLESVQEPEMDPPPRRLIELHPNHPWCNHIYLPPSPQDVLTQLLAPDTICLPVITNSSHTVDGDSMPVPQLASAHRCLHLLTHPYERNTFYLIPSRWIDCFNLRLEQMVNGVQGDNKKSALRGGNKVLTQNPTVKYVLKAYGIKGTIGPVELSWGLYQKWLLEFTRETPIGMTREEDMEACCSIREVLQAQVDWSTEVLGGILM